MKRSLFAALLSIPLICAATTSRASEGEMHGAWEVYNTDGSCYLIGFPQSGSAKSPNATEERYLVISNRKRQGVREELAISGGYPHELSGEITVSISIDGNLPFRLLSYGGAAFAKSREIEKVVVRNLRAGQRLEVKWTEKSGHYYVDKYSLASLVSAMNALHRC